MAEKQLQKVRAAVLERNFHWFNRYRTVDGYSIYGGRASLKFEEYDPQTGKKTGKINTNFEVAQREMEILDEMTANRDKLVWAAGQGKDYKIDDTNTKPFIEIGTQVKAGETLLIIEAMKTMNQIPAPRAGTVKQILFEDGKPVEFGEPLVIIE